MAHTDWRRVHVGTVLVLVCLAIAFINWNVAYFESEIVRYNPSKTESKRVGTFMSWGWPIEVRLFMTPDNDVDIKKAALKTVVNVAICAVILVIVFHLIQLVLPWWLKWVMRLKNRNSVAKIR